MTSQVTDTQAREVFEKVSGRANFYADQTVEALEQLAPGYDARYYHFVVWMSRLCTNPASKGKHCVPAEIVAKLMGLEYASNDDKKNFKERFLIRTGTNFKEFSPGETKAMITGETSGRSMPDLAILKGPNQWSGNGVNFNFPERCAHNTKFQFLTPEAAQEVLVVGGNRARDDNCRIFVRLYLALANSAVQLSDAVAAGQVAIAEPAQESEWSTIQYLFTQQGRRMTKADKHRFAAGEDLVKTKRIKVEAYETRTTLEVERATNESKERERRLTIEAQRAADAQILELRLRLDQQERTNAGAILAQQRNHSRSDSPGRRFFERRR